MKILITESQENTIIEELLKGRFPEIVSVKFRKKSVVLGSYGRKGNLWLGRPDLNR